MKKILLIHPAVRSYRIPLFNLLNQSFDIRFIFSSGDKTAKTFQESAAWKYLEYPFTSFLGYGSDFNPQLLIDLIKYRNEYDILIASGLSTFATHVSFLAARLLKKSFIIWSEDWAWPRNITGRIALPYIKYITRRAGALIAAGTKTRDFLISTGVQSNNIFIAQNCAPDLRQKIIDQQTLKAMRQHINPHGKMVISYLGRIVRYKALDTLIQSFARLEQERSDVLLLIVGDGPFAEECKKLIAQLKIKNYCWPQYQTTKNSKNVEPVPQNELLYFYHLSDIFVLPGRFIWDDNVTCESWGLTLNEALSLGKPLISTASVAAAYDLIKNGENGYRVPENNSPALCVALHRLLNDQEMRKSMGTKSRKLFEEHFQYSTMAQGFQQALESVI